MYRGPRVSSGKWAHVGRNVLSQYRESRKNNLRETSAKRQVKGKTLSRGEGVTTSKVNLASRHVATSPDEAASDKNGGGK